MKTNLRRKPDFSIDRAVLTVNFLKKHLKKGDVVLDIGEMNPTCEYIKERIGIIAENTLSDLDYSISPLNSFSYKFVTCFEVIEHLMNPRTFLDNLHAVTHENVKVFLSYPSRPKFLWNNKDHFHEYDSLRRDLLFEKTGWKIIEKEDFYIPTGKIGIRPIIRRFFPTTSIYTLKKNIK